MSKGNGNKDGDKKSYDGEPMGPSTTEDDDDEYLPEHSKGGDYQGGSSLLEASWSKFPLIEIHHQDGDEEPKIVFGDFFEYHEGDSSLQIGKNQGHKEPLLKQSAVAPEGDME